MYFIVMDLEWNNAYSKKLKGFINEVIEIGAVKLDESLEVVDTFSMFIRAQLGKKLHSRVKELTNITNEDIRTGLPFSQAMSEFRRWSAGEDNIILTWGDSDVRVLIENFKYFNGISVIPFLSNYADLQKYCQAFLNVSSAQQIGLLNAAEMLGISGDEYSLHRAIDDSILSVEIFKAIYNAQMLDSYTKRCDDSFYGRLSFRPHAITNMNDPLVDKSKMTCMCDSCGKYMERISEWNTVNQSFRAFFYCRECKRKIRFTVRFKEYFDRVDVKFSSVPVADKKETEGANLS